MHKTPDFHSFFIFNLMQTTLQSNRVRLAIGFSTYWMYTTETSPITTWVIDFQEGSPLLIFSFEKIFRNVHFIKDLGGNVNFEFLFSKENRKSGLPSRKSTTHTILDYFSVTCIHHMLKPMADHVWELCIDVKKWTRNTRRYRTFKGCISASFWDKSMRESALESWRYILSLKYIT